MIAIATLVSPEIPAPVEREEIRPPVEVGCSSEKTIAKIKSSRNRKKNMNTATTATKLPATPKRYIGICPRVKMNAKQEARPTLVLILEGDSMERFELATERDELDFVLGKWPKKGKYRNVKVDEDLSVFLAHHVIKDDHKTALKEERPLRVTQVPVAYEGLVEGDLVGMSLGGMGDCLAYAISSFGETHGFSILRIPPFRLKDLRGDKKDEDDLLIAGLLRDKPELFRPVAKRDRTLIKLREASRLRKFVQDDRKAAFARVRAATIGTTFCKEGGGFPEGDIEKLYDLAIASDPVAQALAEKEKNLNKQVAACIEEFPIYAEVLSLVKGVGPQLSAPIISAVQDIGLFDTVGKFKAFCGLHILGDGSFPRKRRGERCNWNPSARQSFFLLGDMFNKFADGFWGKRLRKNKVMYRVTHPNPVLRYEVGGEVKRYELASETFIHDKKTGKYTFTIDGKELKVSGKQDYTKAHIHKMAVWRTVSEFAEWLYWKWRGMEGYSARTPKVFPPEDAEAIAKELPAQPVGTSPHAPVKPLVPVTPVAESREPMFA